MGNDETAGKEQAMTNADKIRAMTDEELAKWLARETTEAGRVVTEEKYKWRLDWLKQEVEDGH